MPDPVCMRVQGLGEVGEKAACPLCGGAGRFVFSAGDNFYRVTTFQGDQYRCGGCGSLFMWPRPARELVAAFYPKGYWRESEDSGLLARLQRGYVAWVLTLDVGAWLKRLGLDLDARFLDIGCSRGDAIALALGLGWRAAGLEADARAAAHARQRLGIEVQEQDADSWQPEAEALDGLMAFHLLEHVTDPKKFLNTCRLSLKPGGKLLLRVPNERSWQSRLLRQRWKGLELPRHLTHFHPKALQSLLREVGFEVIALSTWSLRDGPPALSSSLAPSLEPTWREIQGKRAGLTSLLYFALTWFLLPLEWVAGCFGQGSMITIIAKRANRSVQCEILRGALEPSAK